MLLYLASGAGAGGLDLLVYRFGFIGLSFLIYWFIVLDLLVYSFGFICVSLWI